MESVTLGAAMKVVPEVRRLTRPQLQALNVEKKEQRVCCYGNVEVVNLEYELT